MFVVLGGRWAYLTVTTHALEVFSLTPGSIKEEVDVTIKRARVSTACTMGRERMPWEDQKSATPSTGNLSIMTARHERVTRFD